MAAQNVVRRVLVEGKSTGLDKVAQELRGVGAAGEQAAEGLSGVTKTTETVERRALSAEKSYAVLTRRLDDGARSAHEMARGQSVLDAALEQAIIDTQTYSVRLGQLKSRHDAVTIATRADAQAITALRAQIDPLGTAQSRLNTEMSEYAALANRGAISSRELAQAQALARQRFDATADSVRRLKRSANDNSPSNFATANIAAQFQDIGVTAAMGMSPLQIALQQGTQISAAFGNMGAAGAVKALGAAFMSIISPVSLVTIGLVAAVAAAIQYFTAADKADESNEKLREHASLINSVVQAWGAALPALASYNTELERQQAIRDLMKATGEFAQREYAPVRLEMPDIESNFARIQVLLQGNAKELATVSGAYGVLTTAVGDSKARLEDVQGLIDALTGSFLAANPSVIAVVQRLEEFKKTVAATNEVVDPVRIQAGLSAVGSKMVAWLDKAGAVDQAVSMWEKLKALIKDFDDLNKREGAAAPVPGFRGSDIAVQDELAASAAKAEKAQNKLDSAYQQAMKSADQRLVQMQVELQLVGKSAVAVDTARFSLELFNRIADESGTVSADQAQKIQQLTAQYRELAQAVGVARTMDGLQFEADQIRRSPVDQEIYATLRNLGLQLNSIDGQRIADQIKINTELEKQQRYAEDVRDTLKEGASSFLQDLFTGQDLMQSIVQLGSKFAAMNFDAFVDGVGGMFGGKQNASPASKANVVASAKIIGAEVGNAVAGKIKGVSEGPIWERQGRGGMPAAIETGRAMAQSVAPAIQEPLDRQVQVIAGAIKKIESGNNYNAVGVQTKYGKPLGAYQILESNLPQWSQQALGRVVGASEFLGNRLLQDQVAYHQFSKLLTKYNGRFEDVASVWNSGRPTSQSGNIVDPYNGQSVNTYVNKVMGAVKSGAEAGATTGTAAGAKKGTVDAWEGLREVSAKSGGAPAAGGGGWGAAGGLASAGLGGFSTGYQAANPGMGALGGLMQGIGAGAAIGMPVLGAVVGGIAGLIGGFLGARAKVKAARRELEKQMNAINDLLAIGFGKGMGAFQKRIADYNAEADKAVPLAWKAKRFDLVDEIHAAQRAFFTRLAKDMWDTLEETFAAYSSGFGLESPTMKGIKALSDLREELRNFTADVTYFAKESRDAPLVAENKKWWIDNHGQERWEQEVRNQQERFDRVTAEAVEVSKKMILAFIGGRKEFTEYESAVMTVKGAMDVAQTALEELGMSAYAAAEALDKQLNAALAKLRSTLIDDLSRSLYELSDTEYMGDLIDAQTRYNARLRDLSAVGLSADLANRELALSLRNIVKEAKLTDDQIRQLAAAMPELSGSLMGLLGMAEGGDTGQALADAQAKVEEAKSALRSAYEKERSELEATISRLKSFTESIREFRDSMRLDKELSPLDARERLLEAQRQFRETALAAQGQGAAAEAAQGRVDEVARAYLEELRSYYGSNEMYSAGWQEVDTTLAQIEAKAGSQLSAAEKQLSALERSVKGLIDLDDGVKSVGDAIKELQAAQAAETTAKAADDAYKNTVFAEMLAVLKAQLAAQQAATAAQQAAANASTATYSQTDPIANSIRTNLKREPDAGTYAYYSGVYNTGQATLAQIDADLKKHAAAAGIGMASGGWVTGGTPGMDSVLRMLMPEEFIMPAGPARRFAPELEAMRGGRFGGANDNSALVAAMQAGMQELREEVAALQEIIARGFSASVESTDRTAGAIEQGNRELSNRSRSKVA